MLPGFTLSVTALRDRSDSALTLFANDLSKTPPAKESAGRDLGRTASDFRGGRDSPRPAEHNFKHLSRHWGEKRKKNRPAHGEINPDTVAMIYSEGCSYTFYLFLLFFLFKLWRFCFA